MHSYFNIFYHQHIVYLLDIRFNIYIYIYNMNEVIEHGVIILAT